jgi:hypothetical protein
LRTDLELRSLGIPLLNLRLNNLRKFPNGERQRVRRTLFFSIADFIGFLGSIATWLIISAANYYCIHPSPSASAQLALSPSGRGSAPILPTANYWISNTQKSRKLFLFQFRYNNPLVCLFKSVPADVARNCSFASFATP